MRDAQSMEFPIAVLSALIPSTTNEVAVLVTFVMIVRFQWKENRSIQVLTEFNITITRSGYRKGM